MNINDVSKETPDYRQLRIVIGGSGHDYLGTFPHFDVTDVYELSPGQVALLLPDSVAEMFRQQGRRQLQSELRQLIGAKRLD